MQAGSAKARHHHGWRGAEEPKAEMETTKVALLPGRCGSNTYNPGPCGWKRQAPAR